MSFVVLDSLEGDREVCEVSTREEAEEVADTLNTAIENHRRAMQYFYGDIAPLGMAGLSYVGSHAIALARYSTAEVTDATV